MLKEIENIHQLSAYFSLREDDIKKIIENKKGFSKELVISKKNWWKRICYKIIIDSYSKFIKSLNKELYSLYSPNECVHWFIKNKWIISNAKQHLNKKIIINIDIKNFFNSIKLEVIYKYLLWLGLNKNIIDIIFNLVTIDNILPTGFSTSPTISNIVCLDMDNDFLEFAKINWYTYTRYCDDITLSTDTNNFLKKDDIKKILEKYWFTMNEKKFKIQKKWWNRYVTWLTVCENDMPRIPRHIKKRLRQEVYYINKFWFTNHLLEMEKRKIMPLLFFWNVIKWWTYFIQPLEPKLAKSLKTINVYDNDEDNIFI